MTECKKPITIYRADDSDAFGLRTITIKLSGDLVLTNATARFDLLGFSKSWTNAETQTGELQLVFAASDTRSMPLGECFGKLMLFDIEGAQQGSTGKKLTVCNTIPFMISNSVGHLSDEEYNFKIELAVDTEINIDFTVKGPKGDKGDAATIQVGTTTTLPAGSPATVTNVGTSSAAIFNFGIPRGEDGVSKWQKSGNRLSPVDQTITGISLSALEDVDPIENRYTLADVKNLANAILSALKG